MCCLCSLSCIFALPICDTGIFVYLFYNKFLWIDNKEIIDFTQILIKKNSIKMVNGMNALHRHISKIKTIIYIKKYRKSKLK